MKKDASITSYPTLEKEDEKERGEEEEVSASVKKSSFSEEKEEEKEKGEDVSSTSMKKSSEEKVEEKEDEDVAPPQPPLSNVYNVSREYNNVIKIWRGDITRLNVDAVVNPTNSSLTARTAIMRVGGETMLNEAILKAEEEPDLTTGDTTAMRVYDETLPFDSCCTRSHRDGETDSRKLRSTRCSVAIEIVCSKRRRTMWKPLRFRSCPSTFLPIKQLEFYLGPCVNSCKVRPRNSNRSSWFWDPPTVLTLRPLRYISDVTCVFTFLVPIVRHHFR